LAKHPVSNLLALAVLALVNERPMHPYEIATLMRQRGLTESIKLNTGSLYSVVDALVRNELIEPLETLREGRHPERTVYRPTEQGRDEFYSWLRSLIRTPAKEYSQFVAGLSFLPHLAPPEVIALLTERADLLIHDIRELRSAMNSASNVGVDRIYLVDGEYILVLREAELAWVQQLILTITDGTLTEPKEGRQIWKVLHPELAQPRPEAGDPALKEEPTT
jgi:DNA-binding PadR family transcriptional regulator